MDNEQRLIAGCKRGESWALKEIYNQYSGAMMSLCMRYIADTDLAKDAVQDGFIKLFTRIDQYEERGSFGGWIRRIFVNTALEYLSKRDLYNDNIRIEDYTGEQINFDNDTLETISADDLLECITELPDKHRTVFNLYAIEGFSHVEIAQKLGITQSLSRTLFVRARKLLQTSVLNLMKK